MRFVGPALAVLAAFVIGCDMPRVAPTVAIPTANSTSRPPRTPVPLGFDCGVLTAESCMAVADAVFSYGLYLASGEHFVSAKVKTTAVKVCPNIGADATPRFDVVVIAGPPVGQITLTIWEDANGRFGVCSA